MEPLSVLYKFINVDFISYFNKLLCSSERELVDQAPSERACPRPMERLKLLTASEIGGKYSNWP